MDFRGKEGLSVNGNRVWHEGNFDPSTKSNVNHNHKLANLSEKSYNSLTDKPNIPSKVSELENDANYVTQEELNNAGYGDMRKAVYDTNGDGIVDRAETADKLTTARTISLSGDVTGSASFDGSGNISISATVADDSHNHVISNIDNLQTTLNSKAPLASPAFTGTPTAPTAPNGTNTNQIATTKFVQNALSAGGYGDMLKSQYDTDSDGIVDRAETADKLTTARTISLSGDVTGSASFDGSDNISINATVADDSHTHDSRYYTKSEILNNDISMRRLLVNANGVPTSNLGNPTVAEMALFEEQFNNKLAFYDISKFTFEVFDGTTWTDVTSSISTTDKKRLVGGDNTASIVIPNGATKYRITIRNNGSYVYINALYMYWSSNGNSSQIHIWKKRDDGNWVQHTNSSASVSGWPGHLYLPFATIPWSTASTSGHYNDVRIEFTPTWNNANNITLSKLQIWGGYPASKRRIYSIDENKNVTFPASVTATTFNGDLSGKSASADKLATARTITLSGDVSGSASFDGSSNISINATVADDSHNHVISNIDNLQSTLDAKASVSHTHASSEITDFNEATQDAIGAILTDTSTVDFTYDDTNNQIKADVKPNSSNQKVAVSKNSTTPTGTRKQINFKDGTNISVTVADNATNDAVDVTITNTYTHPTGDGNLHVPATGTTNNNKVLKAGSTAGSLSWGNVNWSELTNKPTSSVSSIDNAVTNSHTHSNKALLDTYTQTEANLADAVSKKHAQNTDNTLTSSGSNTINTSGTGNIVDFKVSNTTKASIDNTGKFTGKSASADKLTTARTITLTGDVTGSASFDGSTNISISATVADDSHNHVISNIDNLQTTLNSKAPLASPAFTGTPTAPTAPNGTNTNQIATTAFVQNALSAGGNEHHAKTARFVIGTSTAGWTAKDCDYLCDGTNDQEEIIQALNDLPATGGEVVILDGTYNITASINIPKDNVSLRGNGNATILKRMYNSTNTDSGPTAKGLITLNGKSGCKIQGLQIDGNKVTYTASYNSGIHLYSSSNNTVTGNTYNNNNANGIYLYSSSNNNTVTGNICNNNNSGIRLHSSSNNNTVTGNTCNNNSNYGIYLYSSSNNTVTCNICNNNNNSGIHLYSSSNNNTVTGNTCNNNNSGIYLYLSSNNNTVTGNTCNSNNNNGIYLYSSSNNNTVTGNTCNSNNSGIRLASSSNNTVTGNTCIRGTGQPSDYTSSQYTIRLSGSDNNYNLISSNNCMGKDVVIEGGTGNTSVNNKYN